MNENVKAFVQDLIDNPPADLAKALARDPDLRVNYFREFDLDNPLYPQFLPDAEEVLPELIRRASLGQTITFTEHVEFLGRGNKRQVDGRTINLIVALCITQGLPPLWTLRVRASTGCPRTSGASTRTSRRQAARTSALRTTEQSVNPKVASLTCAPTASPSGRRPAPACADSPTLREGSRDGGAGVPAWSRRNGSRGCDC